MTHETLEGELADQKLSGLLVATNLTESDGTGLVAVRLLDTTGRGGALAGWREDASVMMLRVMPGHDDEAVRE